MPTRLEHDSLGPVEVPADRFWGAQTQRSLAHFHIGHERWPRSLLRALGIVKRSAAIVNARRGLLTPEMRDAIVSAADQVIDGSLDSHFPLVIWQTGSGTQTHMNANEVIAFVATRILGQPVHPNDHVNRSQSSNDVMPTAMHIAAVEDVRLKLLPAVVALRHRLEGKSLQWQDVVKLGRTHGMDAVPLTVGQELSAWVSQLDHGQQAIRNALAHVQELAIGGTAVGTGLNAPPRFGEDVSWEIAGFTQIRFAPAPNRFEALSSHDALVELHGAVKRLAVSLLKIANDVRILASGPRGGLAELVLPSNEPGSSIMPGKVNPTQAEALAMVAMRVMGNDVTVSLAGSQGLLQLNACKPVILHTVIESIGLLADACASFDEHCIAGLEINRKDIAAHLGRSLMLVTALTPRIGYERAAEVAHFAQAHDLSIREAALHLQILDADTLDALLAPERMVAPATERWRMAVERWRWPLYTLVLGISGLVVLPIWLVHVLPGSGWTENLHVARVLSDVLTRGPDAFHGRLWVPTPVSLVPYLLALAGPKFGFVLVARILATLALFALPWAWIAWLRASGRSLWLVVAALPWLMGPAYLQGDLPLLVAWPLWFWALALQLTAMQRRVVWRWLLLALVVALLAVTHPVAWLTIVGLLPLLALMQIGRAGWRVVLGHLVATLLVLVPSAALLLPWTAKILASLGGTRGFSHAWHSEWWLPGDNFRQLADLSLDGFGNHGPRIESLKELAERSGEMLAFAWLVVLVIWLAAAMRQARERVSQPQDLRNPQPVHALAVLTAGYFLLPARLIAPLPLAQFSGLLPPIVAMVAALAIPLDPLAPPASMRVRTWLASAVLCVIVVALPTFAMRSMLLDSVAFGSMEEALASLPANQRVCTVSARSDTRHVRAGVQDDLGAWPLILRGGLVNEPVPDVLWTPVIEYPNGHLPYLPRAQEVRLDDAGACQFFAVFRDPGVQVEQIVREFKPLPRLYSRNLWEIYQNLHATPWPPPIRLTPQAERMVACIAAQIGLAPPQMPPEHAETLQARALLGWNLRCIDEAPEPLPPAVPRVAVPLPVRPPQPSHVPAAPTVLH